jgi:hypothetical protein
MILVQNKTYTASFTFENKKNRLPLIVFWDLRHLKKNTLRHWCLSLYLIYHFINMRIHIYE